MKAKRDGTVLKQKGGQRTLSEEEEEHIVRCIEISSSWGYPIELLDLRLIIKAYLDSIKKTVPKFRDNTPGKYLVLTVDIFIKKRYYR